MHFLVAVYNRHTQALGRKATHGGCITGEPEDGEDLGEREWAAFGTQESKAFWNEPKDLLVTLVSPDV